MNAPLVSRHRFLLGIFATIAIRLVAVAVASVTLVKIASQLLARSSELHALELLSVADGRLAQSDGGHEPDSIDVHEIVLRHETGVRQEVHLRHLIVPATGDGAPPAEKWIAYQFGRPPWGDLAMSKLPATVRTITQAECSGADVTGFWKSLGFLQQYQHYKRGHTVDVVHGAWTVHILVSTLHRVASSASAGQNKGGVLAAEEVVPSHSLIEAWTEVGSRTHTEAIAALLEVCKLLEQAKVELRPLPTKKARSSARN